MRITNVQVNAASFGPGGPASITVSVAIAGASVVFQNPQQTVGFVQPSIVPQVKLEAGSPAGSGPFLIDPSVGVNTSLVTNPGGSAGLINVLLQFTTADR